jgi:cysteine sulfinate desulfinase/cysteine desulfurase-like protein
LLAIGRSGGEAAQGVRFSLGEATTVEEIDTTLAVVRRVVAHMRDTHHEPTREREARARESQVV